MRKAYGSRARTAGVKGIAERECAMLDSEADAGAGPAGNSRRSEMGFIAFLILGIIAGVIAKLIIPGKQAGGWVLTIILGIVGAMLGGWIAGLFGLDVYTQFWSLPAWIAAVVGAIIVLLIYGAIVGRRSSKSS